MTAALTQAAPFILIAAVLIGIIIVAVRQAKVIGRADGEVEDSDARAKFNRKMADRRVAKDLEELRRRAARRRNRE